MTAPEDQMSVIPPPLENDDDDVAWALQTASVQWKRGARADAVVWLRRAVESAMELGQVQRAAEINVIIAGVEEQIVATVFGGPPTEPPAAGSAEIDALIGLSPQSGRGSIDVEFDDQIAFEEGEDEPTDIVPMSNMRIPAAPPEPPPPPPQPAKGRRVRPPPPPSAMPRPPSVAPLAVSPPRHEDVPDDIAPASEPTFMTRGEPPPSEYPPSAPPGPPGSRPPVFDDETTVNAAALDLPHGGRPPSVLPTESEAPPAVVEELGALSAFLTPDQEVGAAPDQVPYERETAVAEYEEDTLAAPVSEAQLLAAAELPVKTQPLAAAEPPVKTQPLAAAEPPFAVPPPEERASEMAELAAELAEVAEAAELAPGASGAAELEGEEPEEAPAATEAAEEDDGEPRIRGIKLVDVAGLQDLPPEAQEELVRTARLETLDVDDEVGAFGIALVIEGWASVMPAIADVACAFAQPGDVVFTQGTLESPVALRVVAGETDTVVAVWDKAALEHATADCPWVADDLRVVADRFQALAGAAMGPLGDRLDDTLRQMVTDRCEVRALLAGDVLVEEGDAVPGMLVIGAGDVEILAPDGSVTEELGPGDFVFASAVMTAGSAPATARAGAGGALLLVAQRHDAHELMVSVPPLLEILAS